MWEIMNRDEQRLKNFMLAMAAGERSWPILGAYDLGWAVAQASQSGDRPLLVDVGGGRGHCLKSIVESTLGLPIDRCVLEDLPEVLDQVRNAHDVQLRGARLVPLDFHKEQPVKGKLTTSASCNPCRPC